MPSAVHHLDSASLHLDGGRSPYRNRKMLSVECKHSKPSFFYSCTALFSTKIVPQDKKKLANAHFTRLCELLKIIQTLYSHLYLVSIQILFSIYSTIIPIILYCFWVFQVFYRHFRDLKMQTTKNKSEILEQCPIQCFAVDFV